MPNFWFHLCFLLSTFFSLYLFLFGVCLLFSQTSSFGLLIFLVKYDEIIRQKRGFLMKRWNKSLQRISLQQTLVFCSQTRFNLVEHLLTAASRSSRDPGWDTTYSHVNAIIIKPLFIITYPIITTIATFYAPSSFSNFWNSSHNNSGLSLEVWIALIKTFLHPTLSLTCLNSDVKWIRNMTTAQKTLQSSLNGVI